MDAIRHHQFGPPEVLRLEQVPAPSPAPGELLVAGTAHGVHVLDTALRRGEASGPLPPPRLPAVPGREVAGTVTAVGAGTDPAWLGRRVVAHLGAAPAGGAYARLVAVPAAQAFALPAGLDAGAAVAMVGTGRTALMTLEVAAPTPDDVVVVTAAAGGLGSLHVQGALGAGARVLALVGGAAKLDAVHALAPGADRLAVVDYLAPAWTRAARAALADLGADGATVVLDGVGGHLGADAGRLLRRGGRLVVHGWSSRAANPLADPAAASAAGIAVRPVVGPGAPDLGPLRAYQERALALAADGTWRVLTHRVPFAEAARAHRELEERRTVGKVVLA
jgi:NADPH2:quinone reductase